MMLRSLLIVCGLLLTAVAVAQPMPPQVRLARDGDWDALQTLLSDGINPDAVYGDGSAALHWAAYHDSKEGVQGLINAGANVNITTDLGVSPLWLAAENGNAENTALLLQAGADPNIALASGETIVMTAAQSGNADVVRQVLAAGANPNVAVTRGQTALMWAANRGNSDVVKVLLEHGADYAARSQVREQYVKSEKEQDSNPAYKYWIEEGGNTPLIFAARSGDLESVQHIVDAGADVNALSAFGTSPLIMAVHGGNARAVEYLLQQGAEVDSSASGHTALHDAILRGNLAAVEVLLEHGANVEAKLEKPTPVRRQSTDYNYHDALLGATPLWLAARFSEPEIMKLLLEHGADPHFVNNVSYPAQRMGDNFMAEEGDISVLMAAAGMGHRRLRMSWGTPERRAGQLGLSREDLAYQAVEVAILAGVDINLADAEGQTALDFAKARRLDSIIVLLLAAGAIE